MQPSSTLISGLPLRSGVGLKADHISQILEQKPDIGWFEVHPENYMGAGGPPHAQLSAIRADYPLSLHGVGLSIGGAEGLDKAHLKRLRALVERYQPNSFSEHLAWSTHQGQFFNDLLALPLTEETLALVCAHVDEAQQALGMRMLLENPATYLSFEDSCINEVEFLTQVAQKTGCGLLLDVNNVYVSCINRGDDPAAYLSSFPHHFVGEIHLAGHAVEVDKAGLKLLIDTHDQAVCDAVWELYDFTLELAGRKPTLIERDGNIPKLVVLQAEADRAGRLLATNGRLSAHAGRGEGKRGRGERLSHAGGAS